MLTIESCISCNVVMLPRKSQSWCQGGSILKALAATPYHKEGQIEICVAAGEVMGGVSALDKRLQLQHLYLTSDEAIKEGEWYMLRTNINGEYRLSKDWDTMRKTVDRKVVASTDPSLGLPAIPQEWIRNKYIASNGEIDSVKLQLQTCYCGTDKHSCFYNHENVCERLSHIKLVPNNEVVIVDESTGDDSLAKRLSAYKSETEAPKETDYAAAINKAAHAYCAIEVEKPHGLACNNARLMAFIEGCKWYAEQSGKWANDEDMKAALRMMAPEGSNGESQIEQWLTDYKQKLKS